MRCLQGRAICLRDNARCLRDSRVCLQIAQNQKRVTQNRKTPTKARTLRSGFSMKRGSSWVVGRLFAGSGYLFAESDALIAVTRDLFAG